MLQETYIGVKLQDVQGGKALLSSTTQVCTLFKNFSKCRIWIFWILAFSTNFCPIKIDLSGNTVWPQAPGFQKLAKMDHFWHFKITFVHSKCKRSSLRSQCWMRLVLWFSNTIHRAAVGPPKINPQTRIPRPSNRRRRVLRSAIPTLSSKKARNSIPDPNMSTVYGWEYDSSYLVDDTISFMR